MTKGGRCVCGNGECEKEAELLEAVIARREYNAAVWKAREEFDRQKLAEQDELAKQKELARQEKLARKAELTRQQKLARQAELAKQKELARQELGLEMEKAVRDWIAGEDCGEAVDPEKKGVPICSWENVVPIRPSYHT